MCFARSANSGNKLIWKKRYKQSHGSADLPIYYIIPIYIFLICLHVGAYETEWRATALNNISKYDKYCQKFHKYFEQLPTRNLLIFS